MPREIGHDKEKVAKLLFNCVLGQLGCSFMQFINFFSYLIENMGRVRPIKAHTRGAFLEFDGAQERRQAKGHTVQCAGLGLGGAFGGLDHLPVAGLLFGGFVATLNAKDMWVTCDHLVGNGIGHVHHVKQATILRNLGMKHHLQEKIPQFTT